MSDGAREHGHRAGALAALRAPYAAGSAEWRAYLTGYVTGLLEEAFKDRRFDPRKEGPPASPARFGSFAE